MKRPASRPLDLDPETSIGIRRGVLLGAAVLVLALPPRLAPDAWRSRTDTMAPGSGPVSSTSSAPRRADFGAADVSTDARRVAGWIARSGDQAGRPFVIVDKRRAAVLVFDADARLVASSPVLIGGAVGDDSVAGIGSRPIAEVRPEERTTPAGRFVAELGRNAIGEDVVWVDYDAAVSMHRVRTTNPAEHRLERLATPSIDDNRVSWGCINVPVAFFEAHVLPIFVQRQAKVYVLPDLKSVDEVFGPSLARLTPDVDVADSSRAR